MFYIRVLFALKLSVFPKAIKIADFKNQEKQVFCRLISDKVIFISKT